MVLWLVGTVDGDKSVFGSNFIDSGSDGWRPMVFTTPAPAAEFAIALASYKEAVAQPQGIYFKPESVTPASGLTTIFRSDVQPEQWQTPATQAPSPPTASTYAADCSDSTGAESKEVSVYINVGSSQVTRSAPQPEKPTAEYVNPATTPAYVPAQPQLKREAEPVYTPPAAPAPAAAPAPVAEHHHPLNN